MVERQALAGLAVSVVVMAMLHEALQLKEIGGAMQAQFFEGNDDYYAVLGLSDTSTQQEIETAYKRATSKFNSRNRDEEERRRRAQIVTAHEALANVETRRAYDNRRRLVSFLSMAIKGVLIFIPLVGLLFLNMRFLKYLSAHTTSPAALAYLGLGGSFEQRLKRSLKRIEWSVEVSVTRWQPDERLGMELRPPQVLPGGEDAIQVGTIVPGGVVDNSNKALRDAAIGEGNASPVTWWSSPQLHVGDVITRVNDKAGFENMREQMQSASTLCFSVRRSMQTLLPWVMEIELSRTDASERWGCQLSLVQDGSDTFEVSGDESKGSLFEGALLRWNEAHPDLRVCKGDRIVAVGRQMKVAKMSERMKDKRAVTSKWLVVRGLFGTDIAPQEVTAGPFEKRLPSDLLGIMIGPALENPVRGHIIEADAPDRQTVVKEVRAKYLVDQWNQKGCGPKVEEGAIVLSVNGRSESREFAAELKKPVVLLRLRPQRGSKVVPLHAGFAKEANSVPQKAIGSKDSASSLAPNSKNSASSLAPATGGAVVPPSAPSPSCPTPSGDAKLLPLRLDLEQPVPFILRLVGRFFPFLLGERSFEVRLRSCLAALRCEFHVDIDRSEGGTLGLTVEPARDDVGGLKVTKVIDGSLIAEHNSRCTGRTPTVEAGDRLVSVNGHSAVPPMVEELKSASSVSRLDLRFSRRAAEAAPGVWEAEVERLPHEDTWGMELREQILTNGGPGSGVLRIDVILPGSAVDRWNKSGGTVNNQWVVEPGDLIVAAAPAVGYLPTVERLKKSQRVRLTLLRWHAGPAPRAATTDASTWSFEVTLQRALPDDKPGIRLKPSKFDPTRTVIEEIIPGGLVERHNQVALSATLTNGNKKLPRVVQVGDEVESINGESDHSRFSKCCQAQKIVLRLARRGVSAPEEETEAPEEEKEVPEEEKEDVPPVAATPASIDAPPLQTTPTPSPTPSAGADHTASKDPPAATAAPQLAKVPARALDTPPQPATLSVDPSATTVTRSITSPAVLPTTTTADVCPSPTTMASARESRLLQLEVQQLKQQVASLSSMKEERDTLLMNCERLRAENAAMQAEAERIERREKALASHKQLQEELSAAVAELETLRRDRQADKNQMLAQDNRLQESLRRSVELSEANSRLLGENEKLNTEVAQLNSKVAHLTARLAEAAENEAKFQPPPEPSFHGAGVRKQPGPPMAPVPLQNLDCLGDGLTRLQELSASLEHILSCTPDVPAARATGSSHTQASR